MNKIPESPDALYEAASPLRQFRTELRLFYANGMDNSEMSAHKLPSIYELPSRLAAFENTLEAVLREGKPVAKPDVYLNALREIAGKIQRKEIYMQSTEHAESALRIISGLVKILTDYKKQAEGTRAALNDALTQSASHPQS